MTLQKTKMTPTVAISISESPDMTVLGLSDEHLRDAMAALASHLLSSGTSLAYGGDLRLYGFTELLFELIVRYQDHPSHSGKITVTDYLAWPVHIRMTANKLAAFSAGHEKSAHLVFLAQDGSQLDWEQRLEFPTHEPNDDEWTEGLTTMRAVMRKKLRRALCSAEEWTVTKDVCRVSPRKRSCPFSRISRYSCSAVSAAVPATSRKLSGL